MPSSNPKDALQGIHTFPDLVAYLRDELDWPIEGEDFEDLTFTYTPEELGIDAASAAKILEIKRLRPLAPGQPWGIFFVTFEPKRLPVVALRRILAKVVLSKRASADRAAWAIDDLLFISNFGEGAGRQISFAHFSDVSGPKSVPTLNVLGWDDMDTRLHMDRVAELLRTHLTWPENSGDLQGWRQTWRSAFVLRHREVVTTSIVLAQRLAVLARTIRSRIMTLLEIESSRGPLSLMLRDFRRSLIHDIGHETFADTYAQTIAYGLLSARIVDPNAKTVDQFARHLRTSPFLQELLQTFLRAGGAPDNGGPPYPEIDFDELGVGEVVALLDNANMEAIVRDFGDRNQHEDPVIHFYELFLSEYDPRARMQRGVFYTPRPVVAYIVRAIDEVLVQRFGLQDGLADLATWGELANRDQDVLIPPGVTATEPFVQILDPAAGTGTFLVEVIECIHARLIAKWSLEGRGVSEQVKLWNNYVPAHLLPRLYGYEIFMAPYSIAHLKVSLKLLETGYEFDVNERAKIFLTNSLDPPMSSHDLLDFAVPALAHEAHEVNSAKSMRRFTVILGNPPYSILSANLSVSQRGLVDRFRFVDGERIRERGALQFEKNIQDDYVKFFAFAEDRVLASGRGVVGFVSNANYLDASTLRGLRASLCQTFDFRRIVDLNGDGSGSQLVDADGRDDNVFEILQAVAIGIYARDGSVPSNTSLSELGGSRRKKFDRLSVQGAGPHALEFSPISPVGPLYEFAKRDEERERLWSTWTPLTEIFHQYSAGIITARDHLVIDEDPDRLADRVRRFRASRKTNEQLLTEFDVSEKKGWDVDRAREQLDRVGSIEDHIIPLAYRPFDTRWIFYHQSLVWGRAFPTMRSMLHGGNLMLAVSKQLKSRTDEWNHVFLAPELGESGFVSNRSKEVTTFFPVLARASLSDSLIDDAVPNVRSEWMSRIAESSSDLLQEAGLVAFASAAYVYAIMHSSTYRYMFREQLARGFPRIPFSTSPGLTNELVRLGRKLIDLHRVQDVPGESATGIRLLGAATRPVERVAWSQDTVWIDAPPGLVAGGSAAGTTGFVGVSEEVWNFRVGSYQVCSKWLKDRRGRVLTQGERTHFAGLVRAISDSLAVMADIDSVILARGGWPRAFTGDED